METKFYTFDQNNSGGYFIEDNDSGVCEIVIVEAGSPEEADEIMEKIGSSVEGFDSYCPCCGERWSIGLTDERDADSVPSVHGRPIYECSPSVFRKRAFIHYKDGQVVEKALGGGDE